MNQATRQVSERDQFRADIYQLLAALLRRTPSDELLAFLASLEPDEAAEVPMARAWGELQQAASRYSREQLDNEYFALFIGLGCGEILPYASWFMNGSLMDTELALLRQDLARMGFERAGQVSEPEDHVAAICEVMSCLLLEAPGYRQLHFFERHLGPWIARFCDALGKAPSAAFYAAVAQLAKAFFELEAEEFERLQLAVPANCPGSDETTPSAQGACEHP